VAVSELRDQKSRAGHFRLESLGVKFVREVVVLVDGSAVIAVTCAAFFPWRANGCPTRKSWSAWRVWFAIVSQRRSHIADSASGEIPGGFKEHA